MSDSQTDLDRLRSLAQEIAERIKVSLDRMSFAVNLPEQRTCRRNILTAGRWTLDIMDGTPFPTTDPFVSVTMASGDNVVRLFIIGANHDVIFEMNFTSLMDTRKTRCWVDSPEAEKQVHHKLIGIDEALKSWNCADPTRIREMILGPEDLLMALKKF